MLDKFVLCQVPCYTEGEESLRRTIDSLSALNYGDKRKLIFIICDGNIIGTSNDLVSSWTSSVSTPSWILNRCFIRLSAKARVS